MKEFSKQVRDIFTEASFERSYASRLSDEDNWSYSFDDLDQDYWEKHYDPESWGFIVDSSENDSSELESLATSHSQHLTLRQHQAKTTHLSRNNPNEVDIIRQMVQVLIYDRKYWIGIHRKIGRVIFDPLMQEKLDKTTYFRLFKLSENKMGLFRRDVVDMMLPFHDNIQTKSYLGKPLPSMLAGAIKAYHHYRSSIRSTHCYRCKRPINSMNFEICGKCGWIMCVCGACGCQYY